MRFRFRAAVCSMLLLFAEFVDATDTDASMPVREATVVSKLLDSTTDETAFIGALLSAMTIEEKLGQLTQQPGGWSETGPPVEDGGDVAIRSGAIGSYLGIHGAELTRRLQRIAVEESRLGIPLMFAFDVIHGFRTLSPMPLAEAASWDLQQIESSARLAAIEASSHGIHWTFAPMVDVSRDPRWGRVVEGAGEDAFLGAAIAAARVRGFQGEDLAAHDTVLATAKHFAAYGAAEGGRDYNVADISERTLREVHLPPFKAAVDAGVQSFMSAFNEINGVPAHASRLLLQDILRSEWGFDGLVVSDYLGVRELLVHGVAQNSAHAGELALNAGVDVDMVSRIYVRELPDSVRSGRLSMKVLDRAVARVLSAKWRLGLFQDPYHYSDKKRQVQNTLTREHRASVRQLAADSMVLLKNERDALPLSPSLGTLAVIGPLADDARSVLGGWAMAGKAEEAVSVLAGIKAAASPDTQVLHESGSSVRGTSQSGFTRAVDAAKRADAVVLVLGETPDMSSEANSRTSLDLPGAQRELAEAVIKTVVKTGKPVVIVLINGRPLSIPWLDEHADAILEAWYPGNEGGNAVADILFGVINPSGKLPMSFPYSVGQIPIYYNHTSTGRPGNTHNHYSSRYLDAPFVPLYPFGHGLSYTQFEYDLLRTSTDTLAPGSTLAVTIKLSNVGDRAGVEIVQLYLRDRVASVTRPVRELKGFQRLSLEPGEAREVRFELSVADLAFLDQNLDWVAEAGTFDLFVSSSSLGGLKTEFTLQESWSASVE